jgi:hypothetical protein
MALPARVKLRVSRLSVRLSVDRCSYSIAMRALTIRQWAEYSSVSLNAVLGDASTSSIDCLKNNSLLSLSKFRSFNGQSRRRSHHLNCWEEELKSIRMRVYLSQ